MTEDRQTSIKLRRDCTGTLIPGGEQVNLSQGDQVVMTQALGGSLTVRTDLGYLVRIRAEDADALGQEILVTNPKPGKSGILDRELVVDELKTIFDPEIPVNVVDLGLIYACDLQELEDGQYRVEVKMSMTAPGCGMGDVLRQEALAKLQDIPGVREVDVEIVWDPPWDPGRMSDAARLQLGMF